ncbi:hypothetical protein D9M70_541330 [compost metagenome]
MLDQVVQCVADHDHYISFFSARKTVGNSFRRFAHRRAKGGVERVAGRRGKFRAEDFVGSGETTGGHHADFFRLDQGAQTEAGQQGEGGNIE